MEDFLSIIIPFYCYICNKIVFTEGLCADCWKNIEFLTPPKCEKCCFKFRNNMEGVCIRCMSEDPYIDKLCACLKYNPYSAKLIMKLKNFADTKVMDFFMPMIKNELINLSIDYIVPIPLHWLRWLWRGYDQAAVIANEIANHIHKPYLPFALKRIRFTQPNVKSRKERAKKIHRAFKVTIKFNGENILLIDDVHTTGATMKECAKILKKAGAGKVIGLVLCKN